MSILLSRSEGSGGVVPSGVVTGLRAGESFESWLRRFSFLRHASVADTLAHLGCDAFAGEGRSEWLFAMSELALARLASFGRVDLGELRDSQFGYATADLLPEVSSALEADRRGWVSLGTLRFCPECVAAGSGFLWRWQLGCTVACVEHSALLRLGCVECGEQRWSPFARPARSNDPVSGDACPACEADLGDAPTEGAGYALLAAQRQVCAALDGERSLFGSPASGDVWFRSLTCAAALASIARSEGKARLRTRPSVIPLDPNSADRVLVDAVDAISSEEAFRELCERAIMAHRERGTSRFSLGADLVTPELSGLWDEVEAEVGHTPGFRYQRERLTEPAKTPIEANGTVCEREGQRT